MGGSSGAKKKPMQTTDQTSEEEKQMGVGFDRDADDINGDGGTGRQCRRETREQVGGELLTVMREGAEGSAGSESNSKDNDGMLGMVDRIGNQRLTGKEA